MFCIFFVLLVFSTGGGIFISKIDNNILIGNISESLWNVTQNQCICEMIQSNGIISTLNYFATNQTCQLFYTNDSSIIIESNVNSSLIFMNQSAIFIAQNQITSTTASTTTTTTTGELLIISQVIGKRLCSQPTWSQTATTIFGSPAGINGSTLSLLYGPIGMYYDDTNNMLIVADTGNQRILQFSLNNPLSVATVIAGSNGYGCSMNQFEAPDGIGVDSSGQLYVTDYFCGQVVRFPSNSNSTTSGTLLGSVALPTLVSVNRLTNDTYVVSNNDSAVYKFVGGNGPAVVAAGGNGNGNALNQLSGAVGVYYDYLYTNSLYVADSGNNRIMKYPSGSTSATYGTVVAGGNGPGSGANQVNYPRSITVDSSGTLYVADSNNNRIQRWLQNASSGITIVGGTQGTASNQFNFPETVLFDKYGNLLVSDRLNNRIQMFNLTTC
ncbi:unnamed protein product [Adineta steineri]|uniref:NHL repeat containing protein n=1 Tax=Adineta steineri TaxID=433720 RepID=A0A819CC85_9BILA|nr:unnamed protein product [Adineta steineri]CAF3812397.1 unnamed protein product [Adineta steineri]